MNIARPGLGCHHSDRATCRGFPVTDPVDPAGPAVARASEWLRANQSEDGSFPCYSSALIDAPSWEPDHVNFVTALAAIALAEVRTESVAAMRDRAVRHLRREREQGDLWRYWSSGSELNDYTPRDVDDTACCSMATGVDPRSGNGRLLLANRDGGGRFYTWLLPRRSIRSLRHRWVLRDERSPGVLARRGELWANSEASADDIDVVVNANVVRYLGPGLAPEEAVGWVIDVILEGAEVEADRWYRSRSSLYRSVAAAYRDGLDAFGVVRGAILDRLCGDPGPASFRSDLEFADALRVLRDLHAPDDAVCSMRDLLLDRQRDDGSWARSICYYGGPQESFGWSSEALATAAAVGALSSLR